MKFHRLGIKPVSIVLGERRKALVGVHSKNWIRSPGSARCVHDDRERPRIRDPALDYRTDEVVSLYQSCLNVAGLPNFSAWRPKMKSAKNTRLGAHLLE
jgi:hypothetical protein